MLFRSLRDLEAGAADSGTFPAVAGAQSAVSGGMSSRMESRNGQPAVTGAYVGSSEPGGHNGGFHPSDGPSHDRR